MVHSYQISRELNRRWQLRELFKNCARAVDRNPQDVSTCFLDLMEAMLREMDADELIQFSKRFQAEKRRRNKQVLSKLVG